MTEIQAYYFLFMLQATLVPVGAGMFRLPINELDEPCPWPLDPLVMTGAPLGQYHCPYCGGMVVAGAPHLDWVEQEVGSP